MHSLLLCVFFFTLSLIYGCSNSKELNNSRQLSVERLDSIKVCFDSYCIEAELARTPAQIERGLMFRKALAENHGMLFIFQTESTHYFWMKNMKFPLDMIWLNGNKEIVDISEYVPVCRQENCPSKMSLGNVQYVLEVNGGFSERHGLKAGQRLEWR